MPRSAWPQLCPPPGSPGPGRREGAHLGCMGPAAERSTAAAASGPSALARRRPLGRRLPLATAQPQPPPALPLPPPHGRDPGRRGSGRGRERAEEEAGEGGGGGDGGSGGRRGTGAASAAVRRIQETAPPPRGLATLPPGAAAGWGRVGPCSQCRDRPC